MISDQEIRTAIKFYTNEPLGTTVAKISWDTVREILACDYDDINGNSVITFYFNRMVKDFAKRKNLYKGLTAKATCNYENGDEWDEKIGSMIAEDRLMAKLSRVLADFGAYIIDESIKFEKEIVRVFTKCKYNEAHYLENLKNLYLENLKNLKEKI